MRGRALSSHHTTHTNTATLLILSPAPLRIAPVIYAFVSALSLLHIIVHNTQPQLAAPPLLSHP